MKMLRTATICFLLFSTITTAEQNKHKDHQHNNKPKTQDIKKGKDKKDILESGKNRELGFDGKMLMEDTSYYLPLKKKCYLDKIGLIMLDKKTKSQCAKS